MLNAPRFWWRDRPGLLARLLSPLGWVYGAITLGRMRRPGTDAGVPVICVGNFIAGGAGKTPTAITLAGLLKARGEMPFVLMRGYGGRLPGPVEVDPARHNPADVGDEAMLMARHTRTIVSRDRIAGATLARANGASVIVMDDGLQNPALEKRLRLAVVDGASGTGNGLCLPAGPLRAPLAGQLGRTDAVIVIGAGAAGERVAEAARRQGKAVLAGRLEPEARAADALRGQKIVALSGIGRPEKFRATLEALGANVASERAFGDHYAYTAADVAGIIAEARSGNLLVATTEKDMTKLASLWPETERQRLVVVPVRLVFDDPKRIETLLEGASGAAGAPQP
ncbi:tetraacyldisaccharide 4'-kinase [Bosea minatitlanensis]|uniref:Tetraacyldisaccharide 4'-kinase n=1 Tax=Bosea minatitlanensis TaxID=128782 RepID=A0ABW0F5P9_9HYPH|nr:tetraacyldisaccharide 4'-kinase [Bosea minatitlanensis]MCT4493210.1 tetraacyldisaccharide 4'-kinase [Bosea minatitlanensis]